jgi:tRNA(Ile)-lysidine synthase
MAAPSDADALEAARTSGLVRSGQPLLVMLSGGADSVCLLDLAVRLGAAAQALHVNYGLRPDADGDEEHCRALCADLGVELVVERVSLSSSGNLQAHAREARYRLAEAHADEDYASAHTASDQAETVLYRLASSPGRRALLGMEPRRGRLVRPLLEATRAETRAYC